MGIFWEGITWAVAAAAWLALAMLPRLSAIRLPPEPGPPTLDPGLEPPAVANLLVSGARARRDAVAATVLDLAARGFVDLAWMGPSLLGCRAARVPDGSLLLPFESRVLDWLRAHVRGDEAPVWSLLPGDSPDSRRWYARFGREVTRVAEDRGLVRPQLAALPGRLLLLAAVVPAGLPALFVWRSGSGGPVGDVVAAVVAAGVLLAAWVLVPRGVRTTAAGREAASRWLGVPAGLEEKPWQGQAPLRDPVPARVLAVGADRDLMAAFRTRRPRTFVGRVALRYQHLDGDAVSWYLAVDGGGPKRRAWVVGQELFDRFPTGDQVRATVDGRGRLLWLAPAVTPAPAAALSGSAVSERPAPPRSRPGARRGGATGRR